MTLEKDINKKTENLTFANKDLPNEKRDKKLTMAPKNAK